MRDVMRKPLSAATAVSHSLLLPLDSHNGIYSPFPSINESRTLQCPGILQQREMHARHDACQTWFTEQAGLACCDFPSKAWSDFSSTSIRRS